MAEGSKKTAEQRKQAKKRNRIIIFVVEIAIILIMLAVVFKVFRMTEESEGPGIVEWEESDIYINPSVKEEAEQEESTMRGYWNIALFGVDAVNTSEIYKGGRSDSIMIASINLDTGEIRLVSVYRDTYLNIGIINNNTTDTYTKATHAYHYGGAQQAINMLNRNLDLNIQDFVTVGYRGLIDCIDGLGGVYIDVDSAELAHINNYQKTIIADVMKDYPLVEVTETGYQLLNGLQATAYCRIRYTKGDDFKRAERQREVIKAIQDRAKQTDLNTLTKVFTKVVDNIYMSLDSGDVLELLGQIANYSIVDEGGFPEESMRTTGDIGAVGSSVLPLDLESNVIWLHQFLFGEENYQVTDEVKGYSDTIEANIRPYLNIQGQ